MVAGHSGQARRIEEDGRAVCARSSGGDAGPGHGTRILLVHAKSLREQVGGESGDQRSSSGETQERKPPHSVFSEGEFEVDGESGRDTVALPPIIVKPMSRPAIEFFRSAFGE